MSPYTSYLYQTSLVCAPVAMGTQIKTLITTLSNKAIQYVLQQWEQEGRELLIADSEDLRASQMMLTHTRLSKLLQAVPLQGVLSFSLVDLLEYSGDQCSSCLYILHQVPGDRTLGFFDFFTNFAFLFFFAEFPDEPVAFANNANCLVFAFFSVSLTTQSYSLRSCTEISLAETMSRVRAFSLSERFCLTTS